MVMGSTTVLPSLLVFGSQTKLPSPDILIELREILVQTPELANLRKAVSELPGFWASLVEFDSSLNHIPGARYLAGLARWMEEGVSFPSDLGNPPNLCALPITVLLQIAQYVRYLAHIKGKDPQHQVLRSIQEGGIQGFCIGLLTAIAVGCSTNRNNIASYAAVSLRLALCIGAYVDQDGRFANPPRDTACVAIRWKPEDFQNDQVALLLAPYQNAYISSDNDDACVTITAPAHDVNRITKDFQGLGFRVKAVTVQGRFHCEVLSILMEKILKFSASSSEMHYPELDELQVPVRSTVDAQIITTGSLLKIAVDCILLKRAHWYETIKAAASQLPASRKIVAFGGFGDPVPPSLLQTSELQVLSLNNVIDTKLPSNLQLKSQYPPLSVAVVGMAGRFSGAEDLDEYWQLLLSGASMAQPAPTERLKLPGPHTGDHSGTKWWGNFLRNPDAFDNRFFMKSSREALAWDPQQRLLLEVTYEALESSGYFSTASKPSSNDYGCYIGSVMSNYYDNVSCHPPTAYATVGTSRGFLSGTISHYFGWTGPAYTIDTACSSSNVAINAACRAITSGECLGAIAGGSNVFTSPFDYRNLQAAGFLSPSGQCKPFDILADGYCRGEGIGVVVLKSLATAMANNDNILGVIIGSACNQNQNFSHISVPHSGSQFDLYQRVMSMGGVAPESVSYIEAHGTGTGVGDPVEAQGIRDAFGSPSRKDILRFCSVKGNIGHTEATAGVAGVIKVLLMMKYSKIPPQASFSVLNPKIPNFEDYQMEIPRNILAWDSPTKIACVNSYGAAGSNSVVMIREKPSTLLETTVAKHSYKANASKYPLFISATTSKSLAMYCQRLLNYMERPTLKNISLLDLVFNLDDRANITLSQLLCTTVSDMADFKSKLTAVASGSNKFRFEVAEYSNPVVLVFSGQESDFIGVWEGLYKSSSLFRHHLDQCDYALSSLGLESLYPAIFQKSPISNLVTLHAALFSVQYSSAKTWIECGIEVTAVIGHSFGQLTALCISGALCLEDALKLVTGRASIMIKYWGVERGSMMWLQANRETVNQILESVNTQGGGDSIEIACFNGPSSHVVVGSSHSIEILDEFIAADRFLRDSVRRKKLQVTHGFHSRFTEPLLPHLTALAKTLNWKKPTIHLETCVEKKNFTEPNFALVSEHMRLPVFFQDAVQRISHEHSGCTWLEAGHGSSIMKLVKGCLVTEQDNLILSSQLTSSIAETSLAEITVSLWKASHPVQYWLFHRSQKHQYPFLVLPPYQFEKTQHWLPFTGRGEQIEAKIAGLAGNAKHELLTFVRFKDSTKREAIFRVDPKSERFQYLLKGHVMAGQCLAPASLSFELVARAAMCLPLDPAAAISYVPCVESLEMRSPIGLDVSKEITLCLNRLDAPHSWSFTISTQSKIAGDRMSEPFEHTSGTVYLSRTDDMKVARTFERYETLTGARHCEDIMNNLETENMQGNHIYRAFNHIVHYNEVFRGVKTISCLGREAAGRVKIDVDRDSPADQRLCDTPMTDSFMQPAGFLVNYFNNPSLEDVFVCHKIERIEISGKFRPDAKEWIVYSTMSADDKREVCADCYVFEAESKRLVMIAFGFQFSKMSPAILARMLKGVNKSGDILQPATNELNQKSSRNMSEDPSPKIVSATSTVRADLLKVLTNVTDVPIDDLNDESTLDELGIDSLMATEVLNDIRAVFGISIDLATFFFFDNVRAVWMHLDEKMGNTQDSATHQESVPHAESLRVDKPTTADQVPAQPLVSVSAPTLQPAHGVFEEVQLAYDHLAIDTKAVNFWSDVYPQQARLVLAYVVEACATLGCDLKTIRAGESVPQIRSLARHKLLTRQLYRVLEDANLISPTTTNFRRTSTAVDPMSAEAIYQDIVDLYPESSSIHKLVRVIGSKLAACLIGEEDGLQLTFGDKVNKALLEDLYANWPLFRTPALLLGGFLSKLFSNSTGGGKFKILEVGAGTGGTTRHIVSHLQSHGILFEYTFTDISTSLVAAAKKSFKGVEEMKFEILDIEKIPVLEHMGAYHVIIATNCIHATRKLDQSLSHLRKMLREDGVLTLVEITKNMFWLDVVMGQFEGWWLFEDGRSHALVDEIYWENAMKRSGFGDIAWTDGSTPESKTVRVIAGFPNARAASKYGKKANIRSSMETFVYKKFGDTEIHADVYYPLDSSTTSAMMPVALMIHGGSHMLFSRKDIRPPQTRLLLEKGFLPVSVDHRLCPEVSLTEGPMVDICDALAWARNQLPHIKLQRADLKIDGKRVVVIGWSSGGQLAMSLAWTAPQRGLRPPDAILSFYSPTNYEDKWWTNPIQPVGAEDTGAEYDLLEAIQDKPITQYDAIGAWAPFSDSRILTDPRCRILLHINWKAQTLPIILGGLPSKKKLAGADEKEWYHLPQPTQEKIIPASPFAQIIRGGYRTPTFFIHGTNDELIPWQQTQKTYEALVGQGVAAGVQIIEGAPHICDLSSDPESDGWKAVLKGYDFISSFVMN